MSIAERWRVRTGQSRAEAPVVTAATHRTNNLDFLRLVGSLAVVLGHAYVLVGRPANTPVISGMVVHSIGVIIFFSISGYLITASWGRNPRIVSYMAARCLRIFPALIVVVLAAAFVIGPLVTTLPTSQYLSHEGTWSYLYNIVLRVQYALPGVWAEGLPYPVAVNGSLWTLPAEFLCYLVVPLVFLAPARLRPPVIAALLAYAWWLAQIPATESAIIWQTLISPAAEMWVFFATGAILRLLHERGLVFRADAAALLLAGYMVLGGMLPQHALKFAWVAVPYVVLTIGLAATPYLRRTSRFGDLSYGVYLWAFPVQQLVIDLSGVHRMSVNLLLVTSATLVLAWLSWHLVEHPALKLKDRIARRSHR